MAYPREGERTVTAANDDGLQGREPRQEHRAEPPRAPVLPTSAQQADADREAELRQRETLERRSMLRGLLLLAVLVLLISIYRAGLQRAFPAGWLHRW